MNYLALCQKVNLILRLGNETPGTEPTTVTAQDGPLYEMVQWVRASHEDICFARTDWNFMRANDTLTFAQGERAKDHSAIVAVIADFDRLLPFVTENNGYIGIVPDGVSQAAEMTVIYVPYQQWQGAYDAPPIPTGQPTYFTITPEGGIEFDSIPDRAYIVRINYRRAIVQLDDDADEPMFPERYHNAIVWWAILHYYCLTRDKTAELRGRAEGELKREMSKLFNEQLPDFLAV